MTSLVPSGKWLGAKMHCETGDADFYMSFNITEGNAKFPPSMQRSSAKSVQKTLLSEKDLISHILYACFTLFCLSIFSLLFSLISILTLYFKIIIILFQYTFLAD